MEVITTHVNADFDAMASMIAAKRLYPDAVLVFPGSQERTLREFFVQSTVYLYDFKRLKDVDFDQIHRLILVDTRQTSRIGKFEEIVNRPGIEIHVYDHHPAARDDVPAQVAVIKPLGATVTVLTQLIRERGITLTPEEATIMSLGLFEDTGSFMFNSTTPEDFEAAAFLRRCGADLNVVADMVTQELTAEQVNLLNELILSARTYTIQGIDVCIATVSIDKYVGDFAVLVHKFKDIHNLDVIFALARMEDRIYVVARSRLPEVNVGAVVAYFGGGGHATAAAATIRDMTPNQLEDRLLEILRSHITPFPTAETLMTSPAITVDAGTSMGEASQLLVRYNINAVPVMENGSIVGVINRQILEKAVFHGLQAQTVREFMNVDVGAVGREATIIDIQTYLVEHQHRLLPVLDDGRLAGVITRRDLLNFLVSDQATQPKALHEDLSDSQWPKRKNISNVLTEMLPRPILRLLRDIGEMADKQHVKVYAIGGFVRDLLLRRPNLDIDIVVEGDGIEFAKSFAEKHNARARCHRKFNTAVLVFNEPEGFKVDVASARFEYYQFPAALPIVEFGSLKMDLYRRDFTINTLAVALNPAHFGQLIDFFDAQRDLKEKTFRVLHSLSFVEDPTRIMRAIRFEGRFGFRIGKQTASLMRNAVRMGLIQKLGGHRLLRELQLILMESDPLPALRRMSEFGLMSVLSPRLRFDEKAEELFNRLREVISWYRLSFLEETLDAWWVYILGLFAGRTREDLEETWQRLDFTAEQRERMLWTYEQVESLMRRFFQLPDHKPSDIYRALQPFKAEELLFMMARTQREETRRAISRYFHRYRHVRTELRGRDLKALGITPGPIYRGILDELLSGRLDGDIKSRQEELAHVQLRYGHLMKDEEGGLRPISVECAV